MTAPVNINNSVQMYNCQISFQGACVQVHYTDYPQSVERSNDDRDFTRIWSRTALKEFSDRAVSLPGGIVGIDPSLRAELNWRAMDLLAVRKRLLGGLRGKIGQFSAASRLRLLRLIARLELNAGGLFLTFTYRQNMQDYVLAKKHLDLLLRKLKRHFGDAPLLWRMEEQERGSIHFHIIVFGKNKFIPAKEITAYWQTVTGDDSYPDIERLNGRRHVLSYVAKYVAKVPDPVCSSGLDNDAYSENAGWRGRYWGIVNRRFLPLAPVNLRHAADRDKAYNDFRRAARRFYCRAPRGLRGFTMFCDARQWLRLLDMYQARC